MFYREAGQFNTTYDADSQIFPIRQDRVGVALMLAVAFVAVPLVATPYVFSAILIPFLIFSLAALGLNILTGYAGQISLGTAAFMAVGAFASYNFVLRIPGIPLLVAFMLGGLCAAAVGILFGLPSLRIRGFYLAASPPVIAPQGPVRGRQPRSVGPVASASAPAAVAAPSAPVAAPPPTTDPFGNRY